MTSFEAYVSDVIERRFENRSEVQMSVTYKSDMYLRIGRRLETGRQSESYTYNSETCLN